MGITSDILKHRVGLAVGKKSEDGVITYYFPSLTGDVKRILGWFGVPDTKAWIDP